MENASIRADSGGFCKAKPSLQALGLVLDSQRSVLLANLLTLNGLYTPSQGQLTFCTTKQGELVKKDNDPYQTRRYSSIPRGWRMQSHIAERVFDALEKFRIELPSWGFANTGTRFGKFIQPAAATTTEEKFSDAGEVQRLTGVCPTVALHVLWDCPKGVDSSDEIQQFARRYGVQPGSINPNLFQDQQYKYGSFGNPDPAIRDKALQHTRDSIEIARRLQSIDISMWFADGSNYPGTANVRQRKQWFEQCLRVAHNELSAGQRLLVEYKPFEPAFYHTDIGDWGMALLLARHAGPQARVLVDTGHHYQAQNIEQIVAWLLAENMLGGFHFNDRRYADDDLTMGSIDPYQVFRIFHEIHYFEWETGRSAGIAYMVDQSHNLKGKIEAMIQTVTMAQQLFAKAALVEHAALAEAQKNCQLVKAESLLQDAFATDVRPAIEEWRNSKGLPQDPMDAFQQSGYLERITKERSARNSHSVSSYA
jgi:L-rhamnose isomerase / sugar isomerase